MASPRRSPRRDAPAPRHHGDLLNALIQAAEALLVEPDQSLRPHEAERRKAVGRRTGDVTLRALASKIGEEGRPVSHTAAMAHVGSVLELLTHVAAKWWGTLVDELQGAAAGRTPRERLVALGVRYRDFAAQNERQFRLMYDARIWSLVKEWETRPDETVTIEGFKKQEPLRLVWQRRNAAFDLFRLAAFDGQADGTLRKDASVDDQARLLAALSHGLAMEALDEKLSGEDGERLLRIAVRAIAA